MSALCLRPFRYAFVCLLMPLFAGCNSLSHFEDVSTATSTLPRFSGTVHGGQQPVAGASIQLYAASSTANKGASTALLITPVNTDSNGNFSITGDYTCPAPSTLVYITATGGNPGLAAGTNNAGLNMLAALGTCSTFFTGGNNIHIVINELTTVAAVEALAPFTADLAHIGADPVTAPNALSTAVSDANALVDYASGQLKRSPGDTAQATLYNTLANILASCINSAGNTGSTSTCAKLFAATGGSTDIVSAMLYIARHPGSNIPALYSLAGGVGAPFQPQNTSAPNDFTVGLVINIPNTGEYRCCTDQQLAIDTAQQIWVGNQTTKGVHVYSNAGVLLHTFVLPQPLQNMASDPLGNVWFLTTTTVYPNHSLTKYNSSGTLLSPPGGFQADQGPSVQLVTYGPTGQSMRFDSTGSLWITGSQAGSGNYCALKFSNAGAFLLPVCLTANGPTTGLAVDKSDNLYVAQAGGVNKVSKFNSVGVAQTFTQTVLSSNTGVYLMHYDPALDHIWLFDGNAYQIFSSSGAVIKARVQDALNFSNPFGLDDAGYAYSSSVYPVGISQLDPTGTVLSPFAGYQSYNALTTVVGNFEVDGQGNLWAVGGNNVLARISGLAGPRSQLYR